MKRAISLVWRYGAGLRRPSSAANARKLRDRGERIEDLVIREAVADDIPALAALHVKTWNATYAPLLMRGPSVAVREGQWREAFAQPLPNWFCLVVQRPGGELVGFAKGIRGEGTAGELNKIYLINDYQRLGLGRRLLCRIARRLIDQGATTLAAYTDARNPSGWFFEKMGGSHRTGPDGRLNTEWYHWPDLAALVSRCSDG